MLISFYLVAFKFLMNMWATNKLCRDSYKKYGPTFLLLAVCTVHVCTYFLNEENPYVSCGINDPRVVVRTLQARVQPDGLAHQLLRHVHSGVGQQIYYAEIASKSTGPTSLYYWQCVCMYVLLK